MHTRFRLLWGAGVGAVWAAAAVSLSRLLIRSLGPLFRGVGALAGMDAETVSYGAQVAGQLKTAQIGSPWLPALLIGAALGLIISCVPRKAKLHAAAKILLGLLLVLLMLLCTAACLYCTEINSIRLSALLSALLPALPHLF